MTNQLFINPNNLSVKIIEHRLAPLDENIQVEFFEGVTEGERLDPTRPTDHYFWIKSDVLTITEIDAQLSSEATPEEQSYLDEFNGDRIAFRQQYATIRDQLQAIEDKQTFTNAEIISAVKFLSKTVRQLMRLLVKTRFSS